MADSPLHFSFILVMSVGGEDDDDDLRLTDL